MVRTVLSRGVASSEVQRLEPYLTPRAWLKILLLLGRSGRCSGSTGGRVVVGQCPQAAFQACWCHTRPAYVEDPEAAHYNRRSIDIVVAANASHAGGVFERIRRTIVVRNGLVVVLVVMDDAFEVWKEGGRKGHFAVRE